MQLRHSFARTALPALFLSGLAAFAAPAHAQVVNGDFETYDALTVPSWTVSGNANMGTANDVFLFGYAHSGNRAAWLATPGSDGFLSQTLATTPGTTYTISYWLAVDGSAGTPIPNDFSASFGGTSLFSTANLAATDSHADAALDYTLYSFTTVASGTSSELQFGFRNDNSEFRLDDVTVEPAPVPEASTTLSFGLLLLLGVGAAIVKSRRRAASAA